MDSKPSWSYLSGTRSELIVRVSHYSLGEPLRAASCVHRVARRIGYGLPTTHPDSPAEFAVGPGCFQRISHKAKLCQKAVFAMAARSGKDAMMIRPPHTSTACKRRLVRRS